MSRAEGRKLRDPNRRYLAQRLMDFHLRKNENVYCECLKKEEYGETRDREGWFLLFPLEVFAIFNHFNDE